MTWMDHLSALLSRKSSRAGAAVAAVGLAPARWTPRRYDRLAEEGYRKNVVAYRCVREVARACASVPWLLYTGRREMDVHPLLDLLRRPNPRQSGPELIEAAVGHLLLSGNAYFEVVRPDDAPPRELYALRPDRMRVVPDVSGVPRAYRYEVEGRSVDWPVDPMTGASDVLHLRDFHPLDDWYGLSPIEAAASAIDQHNAAAEHNAALLQNGARPSGALVFRSDPGPDGIRRVEEALLDRTQGPRQAGRPLVLGGDVDWKELGLSPKDMDFAETKAQAAREIAAAFGVPHLLVVSGEATFSNRADARLELWEHTVIPLLDRLSSALSTWLGPMFGPDLRLAHDLDEIPALAPRRRMKWQQIQAADFLTLNEKRAALGYEPVEEGEAMQGAPEEKADGFAGPGTAYERVYNARQPRDAYGRWTSIDWGRIRQWEGGQRLEGYVPMRKDGSVVGGSGVTIASGFDIGQHSAADFDRLEIWPPSVKDEIREVLRPYFGVKGEAAKQVLSLASQKRRPPVLTADQAEALDTAVFKKFTRDVGGAYDRALDRLPDGERRYRSFDDLPREARTVIVSFAYQHGMGFIRTQADFWGHVTRQDWRAAETWLSDLADDDKYPHRKRRENEAAFLRGMIARLAGSTGP